MDPTQLTQTEWVLIISWGISFLAVLFWAWHKRDPLGIFSPPVLLVLVNFYYCFLGPLNGVLTDNTAYKLRDFRPDLELAWFASLLSFVVTVLAYRYLRSRPRLPQAPPIIVGHRAWRLGLRVCQVALIMYVGVVGIGIIDLINPFGVSATSSARGYGGAFTNYLNLGINLLIPGLNLMWIGWLQQRQHTLLLISWLAMTAGIYTSLGFRYRLALLAGSLYILYHLVRRIRPNLLLAVALCGLLIFGAGYIGAGRNYGRGLDLATIESKSPTELFLTGLDEASIFWTSAGVLETVPQHHPYVGFRPVINTLLFPVPSALFPGKDSGDYLFSTLAAVYGSLEVAAGAAFMGWAEWYLMGGWFGLIAISALMGWAYRRLWEWFRPRRQDALAASFYAGAVCYQYVILSRGYMPQQAMLFGFTVLPLWFLYRWFHRRERRVPGQPLPRTALPGSGFRS